MPEIKVSALYRYPVKSMTPERVKIIDLTADGRIKGDRVLGFRFRNAGDPSDWSWHTKQNFVGLVNTPALARLTVSLEQSSHLLRIFEKDLLITEGQIDNGTDRSLIEQTFTDYIETLQINPLKNHPERQPVALLGDGEQPLFHDTAAGLVTLHSEESVTELGSAMGDEGLNGLRFRSNIVVRGLNQPFGEMNWVGRRICIGDAEFKVLRPVNRCLVTHANPVTGVRDRDVMNTLAKNFTSTERKPQFAVMLQAVSSARRINQGDSLEL